MDIKQTIETARANPELVKQSQQKMQELLSRSATDAEFRQKLLTDPRSALTEWAGREVSMNIVFVENKADATIVLPPVVDPAAELSEAELEAVAGGITPTVIPASLAGWALTLEVAASVAAFSAAVIAAVDYAN